MSVRRFRNELQDRSYELIVSTEEQNNMDLVAMLEAQGTLYDRLNVIFRRALPRLGREEARRLSVVCAEVAVMCERGSKALSNREACLLDAAATYLKDPSEENRRAAAVQMSDIPDPNRRGDTRRSPWAPWAAQWAFDVIEDAPYRAVSCALLAATDAGNEGVDLTEANTLLMKAVADL